MCRPPTDSTAPRTDLQNRNTAIIVVPTFHHKFIVDPTLQATLHWDGFERACIFEDTQYAGRDFPSSFAMHQVGGTIGRHKPSRHIAWQKFALCQLQLFSGVPRGGKGSFVPEFAIVASNKELNFGALSHQDDAVPEVPANISSGLRPYPCCSERYG